jgi:periplasmic protein TonB
MQRTVDITFVVDTAGKADMTTFKVISSPHDAFTASVRSVLPRYRYVPAEVDNRKVRVWVQQRFQFKLGG